MGNLYLQLFFAPSSCVKSFQSTSDRPVSRSVTPAGSSSASSTVFSQTVRCHPTRPSVVAMMLSTPSSPRLVLASTSQEPSSLISSQPLSMRSEPEPTDSSSTRSSSSPERKMPPTTSPVVTTPLVRKLLTSALTESESSLTSALDSRDSLSSTPLLSHTTPCSQPTPSLSTPMSPSCSTTKPSTASAEETSTLRDQPTPT